MSGPFGACQANGAPVFQGRASECEREEETLDGRVYSSIADASWVLSGPRPSPPPGPLPLWALGQHIEAQLDLAKQRLDEQRQARLGLAGQSC